MAHPLNCPFVNIIPARIKRINRPRLLGMIIHTLKDYPNGLSAGQIAQKLKDKGYKYYPATRTCASYLGKHSDLFEELNEIRIGDRQETWKVKTYKMRDGWNVD